MSRRAYVSLMVQVDALERELERKDLRAALERLQRVRERAAVVSNLPAPSEPRRPSQGQMELAP